MRYSVTGLHQTSGKRSTFIVEADTAEQARAKAMQRGMFVAELRPLDIALNDGGEFRFDYLPEVETCIKAAKIQGWTLLALGALTFVAMMCGGLISAPLVMAACVAPFIFGAPAALQFWFANAAERSERWGITGVFGTSIGVVCIFAALGLVELLLTVRTISAGQPAASLFGQMFLTSLLVLVAIFTMVCAIRARAVVRLGTPGGPQGFAVQVGKTNAER